MLQYVTISDNTIVAVSSLLYSLLQISIQLSLGIINLVIVLLIALAFYSAYLPPVRVAIYTFIETTWEDRGHHDLCNVPLKNHWDFTLREVYNFIV